MTSPGHTQATAAETAAPNALVDSADQAAVALPENRLHRIFVGRSVLRRVVFVIGYEGLGVLATVFALSGLLGHSGGTSTLVAILVSTVATAWNYVWNTIFEAIERRRGAKGRGVASRAAHAIGYEGGVLIFTIPLVAFMLNVTFKEAMVIEASLLVFFLVFTVVYTWVFDKVFGLPDSAR